MMKPYYTENIIEAGIDEVGRGPLFGRVYTAAVILPNDPQDFNHQLVKDSKKFTSKQKFIKNELIFIIITGMLMVLI